MKNLKEVKEFEVYIVETEIETEVVQRYLKLV
jgi:hypothetical protein